MMGFSLSFCVLGIICYTAIDNQYSHKVMARSWDFIFSTQ
jgi:hypothetical protein